MIPESVTKSEAVSAGGASWATFGGPTRLCTLKSGPPPFPKCYQWSKNEPKMIPKSPTITKQQNQAFSGPGLADCAKRLQ